jgi:ribonuclease D
VSEARQEPLAPEPGDDPAATVSPQTPAVEPVPLPAAEPLLEPREGVPAVVITIGAMDRVIEAFVAGTGPVAVDAERASGYRYGQRAYLVQLRRQGAGTALIDPIACPDLSVLDAALAGTEMVLHAANQDLPCLAEVGLVPRRLFDTELAGRLLGHPRVGLGSMVETVLGFSLEKGHSAADWSTRPLPEDWLRYAALDVELLVELRDALHAELVEAGKLDWAMEEFAAILAAPPKPPRSEPWRRTSGIHRVRNRRALAIVRELWEARDQIAQDRDISPGRVLSDAAIIELALTAPRTPADLTALATMRNRGARRHLSVWLRSISTARSLPESEQPEQSQPGEGPPPAHRWAERDPEAAKRLSTTRAVVSALADEHHLPSENLVQPDAVRRLTWSPPTDLSAEEVAAALRALGARNWQVELVSVPVAKALQRLEIKGDL